MNTQEEKPMKLISMVDFVLEQEFGYGNEFITAEQFAKVVCRYANFLKQPLTLGTFVSVDENEKVLAEPEIKFTESFHRGEPCYRQTKEYEDYKKAKDKVLFEGFSICNRIESVKCVEKGDLHFSYENAIQRKETIESIAQYGLELTETAKNQIFQ